jgi:hypothetical protein
MPRSGDEARGFCIPAVAIALSTSTRAADDERQGLVLTGERIGCDEYLAAQGCDQEAV